MSSHQFSATGKNLKHESISCLKKVLAIFSIIGLFISAIAIAGSLSALIHFFWQIASNTLTFGNSVNAGFTVSYVAAAVSAWAVCVVFTVFDTNRMGDFVVSKAGQKLLWLSVTSNAIAVLGFVSTFNALPESGIQSYQDWLLVIGVLISLPLCFSNFVALSGLKVKSENA